MTRDEHALRFKSCSILVFGWIGFYNFCLTRFGLELMLFFWTS